MRTTRTVRQYYPLYLLRTPTLPKYLLLLTLMTPIISFTCMPMRQTTFMSRDLSLLTPANRHRGLPFTVYRLPFTLTPFYLFFAFIRI